MTLVQRVTRQPNIVLGVVTAGINMLVLLNIVGWNGDQVAGINIFAAALFGLVALMVTPTAEVVVHQAPGEQPKATKDLRGGVSKGDAVWVAPAGGPGGQVVPEPPNEGGYFDVLLALAVVVVSTAVGFGLFLGWEVSVALLVMIFVVGFAVIRKRMRAGRPMIVPTSMLDRLASHEAKHAA